jgi:hypothetical protein
MATKKRCTTMATIRKRCEGGPLLPRCLGGKVSFLVLASNIKGFRYRKHDKATSSGIATTKCGRQLVDEFQQKIGLEPAKLYSISQAAEIVERSKELWLI